MPRYDKYQPHAGGFRAPLAVATTAGNEFTAYGVGLNASGHVVLGGGQTGIVGVMIPHGLKKAGDIVDVMTGGEVVEFTANGVDGTAVAAAGTVYYAATATGAISTTTTGKALGFTAEGQRLIVRMAAGATVDSIGAS